LGSVTGSGGAGATAGAGGAGGAATATATVFALGVVSTGAALTRGTLSGGGVLTGAATGLICGCSLGFISGGGGGGNSFTGGGAISILRGTTLAFSTRLTFMGWCRPYTSATWTPATATISVFRLQLSLPVLSCAGKTVATFAGGNSCVAFCFGGVGTARFDLLTADLRKKKSLLSNVMLVIFFPFYIRKSACDI
jgi:hypothetical protein